MNEIMRPNEGVVVPEFSNVVDRYNYALKMVDDIVLKGYITNLSKMDIVPIDSNSLVKYGDNVLFFKIKEMVYDKNEYILHKLSSVYNSLIHIGATIFLIIDADSEKNDFYMGVKTDDPDRTVSSSTNMLRNALVGQFPGIKIQDDYEAVKMEEIVDNLYYQNVSAVTCVADSKGNDLSSNQEFVQGLEKMIDAMQGKKYTEIIIASSSDVGRIQELRKTYESIYSSLAPFASVQFNRGENLSYGTSESSSEAESSGTTESTSASYSEGDTRSHSISKNNMPSKTLNAIGSVASIVGTVLAPITGGISLGVGGLVAAGANMASQAVSASESESTSTSYTKTDSISSATTATMTYTSTKGWTDTRGTQQGMTYTSHNKTVEGMLERIDKQLKRIERFESYGMFECAAYFLSDDVTSSEMAATIYKSIVGGMNSGVEMSAINSWNGDSAQLLAKYVKNFTHPVFVSQDYSIGLSPCAMIGSDELSIHMGLPRKSVCGFPVIDHADFAREIVRYDMAEGSATIELGKVFNMGASSGNNVRLDKNSFSMHAFITGSTGSGKSNTTYKLIEQMSLKEVKFLVIEPTKGEYKHMFAKKAKILGTNPHCSDLLAINPFAFPENTHVLEHIDRLIEIFNVCWEMYAAMPAILKEASIQAYKKCGWNLFDSTNKNGSDVFPNFVDLLDEIKNVIETSAYSEEVKGNYIGSLVTRVKSLTGGLYGQIFNAEEIDNKVLFDGNTIVDLSRIGSSETKSLIMGILIMRLNEHRMAQENDLNAHLKHITILEEAHNILKNSSVQQGSAGSNIVGKSVEMISNAIAEMRTYGEGFIIVDQSPSAVDISAIKNTNTKIIMRLPNESDRRLAGKSAGLRDDQVDEIGRLPKGVAVVYQNDWVEPILCNIDKYPDDEKPRYTYTKELKDVAERQDPNIVLRQLLLQFLLKYRVKNPVNVDVVDICESLVGSDLSTRKKLSIQKILEEYTETGAIALWDDDKFDRLSEMVSGLLDDCKNVRQIIEKALHSKEDLGVFITNLINDIGNEIYLNKEYSVAIAHCLLVNYSYIDSDFVDAYSGLGIYNRQRGVI